MQGKNSLLLELKDSVLKTLFDYCNTIYYDQKEVVFHVEVIFKNEIVTSAFFDVTIEIVEYGSTAVFYFPATPDIVRFRLNKSYIRSILGTRGRDLSNIKKALNSMLTEHEGKILKE